MTSLSGHCLCGSVSYTADTEPMMVALCHCEDCKRQSGAAFSVNVVVERSALKIDGDKLTTYETIGGDHEQPRERLFCSGCGSPLVSILAEAGDMAFIKAGTLDDQSWVAPEIEVYCDSAQPWVHAEDNAERGLFPQSLPS